MPAFGIFVTDLVQQAPLIVAGLGNTLLLAGVVSVTGFALGLVVFYCAQSPRAWLRGAIGAYVSFFIGMPLVVLLFLVYYGAPQLGVRLTPFTVAALGFTLNVAAYNAAYLGTARNGLDPVEIEAAVAQGFSHWQVFRQIMLPQVLRQSVPALTNQVILNIKDSTVAFLIQYVEFFARIQELASTNFRFFEAYTLAAVVYLALVSLVVLGARALERRVVVPGLTRARH
jgi:polar amino acid transport system permease protein